MDINIENKKEEPLLSRAKVEATISFQGATPSYADIAKKIASSLKAEENTIAIRHVYTQFGLKKARVIVMAYKDEKSKTSIEPKVKKKGAKKEKSKPAKSS